MDKQLYENLMASSSGSNWILCDCFDSILKRTAAPLAVRRAWAKSLAMILGCEVSGVTLFNVRQEATRIVLKTTKNDSLKYRQITNQMYLMLNGSIGKLSSDEFYDLCLSSEVSTESLYLENNDTLVLFLKTVRNLGKRIALVSDYYLGKDELLRILSNHHLDRYFDAIFVSCDYGEKKETGGLYRVVRDFIGHDSSAIMIGDNLHADTEMAKLAGFTTFALQPNKLIETPIETELKTLFNKYRHSAFANYSFLFYQFIEELYSRLLDLKTDRVFFLAREGYFLMELFNDYQSNQPLKVETTYLYASRKSTLLASLDGDKEVEFKSIFNSCNDLDVTSFLKNLSFTDEEIDSVTSRFSYDASQTIYTFSQSDVFRELISLPIFKSIISAKCSEARQNLFGYLKDLNAFSSNSEEIVLVDVGWKGTIQDNIFRALNGAFTVRGLYLGIENHTGFESCGNIKEGLIFSRYPLQSKYFSFYDFETHLIEQILAAPHASTRCYRCKNGLYHPQLEVYSEADRLLYVASKSVQSEIQDAFGFIHRAFSLSEKSAFDMRDYFVRLHLKSSLILSRKCIEYESSVLTPQTNNFGWFQKIPTRSSKKAKLLSMIRDLCRIHGSQHSIISYLSYFSIKLNARRRYAWKLVVYRVLYPFIYLSSRH